jgi:hypothetical protein
MRAQRGYGLISAKGGVRNDRGRRARGAGRFQFLRTGGAQGFEFGLLAGDDAGLGFQLGLLRGKAALLRLKPCHNIGERVGGRGRENRLLRKRRRRGDRRTNKAQGDSQ